MKEILEALFLGIIQGVTEFLPISSSGHMSIFRHFTGMELEGAGLFSAMLHMGTLVAIFVVFYKPIYELFIEFFGQWVLLIIILILGLAAHKTWGIK